MKQTKLGIVLSGGGAKGAYEVGFLKALAEFNIQPDAIAGTSIGALNGAIYSVKKDTKETLKTMIDVWDFISKNNILQIDEVKALNAIISIVLSKKDPAAYTAEMIAKTLQSKKGILKQAPIRNQLIKYAPPSKLKQGLPFYVGLTKTKRNLIDTLNFFGLGTEDAKFKKIQNLDENIMHDAIIASAALPLLFNSIKIEGVEYRDGCLGSTDNEWGNTPAKPLVEQEGCTHLIICHLTEGSLYDRNDPLFKNTNIIEVRPKTNTFKSALDPLNFNAEDINKWIKQGYEDSKTQIAESLNAILSVETRKIAESISDNSIEKLKSRDFKLS